MLRLLLHGLVWAGAMVVLARTPHDYLRNILEERFGVDLSDKRQRKNGEGWKEEGGTHAQVANGWVVEEGTNVLRIHETGFGRPSPSL